MVNSCSEHKKKVLVNFDLHWVLFPNRMRMEEKERKGVIFIFKDVIVDVAWYVWLPIEVECWVINFSSSTNRSQVLSVQRQIQYYYGFSPYRPLSPPSLSLTILFSFICFFDLMIFSCVSSILLANDLTWAYTIQWTTRKINMNNHKYVSICAQRSLRLELLLKMKVFSIAYPLRIYVERESCG